MFSQFIVVVDVDVVAEILVSNLRRETKAEITRISVRFHAPLDVDCM